MKTIMGIVLLFSLSILTLNASATPELRPLPRVVVAHCDTSDNDTLLSALAAIPISVFHYNGKVYQSPLVADDLSIETTNFLLDDYVTYLSSEGGVQQLILVGQVPAATQTQLMAQLGIGSSKLTRVLGSPIVTASQIATDEWTTSEYVVIAPYTASPGDMYCESAAAAAAIASDLNAPLLYTFSSGLPWQTKDAISAIHASKAIIVDYGSVLPSSIVSQLAAIGVTVTDNLKTTAAVIANTRARNGQVTLCQAWNNWQLLAAAYCGAVYSGAVFNYEAFAAGNSTTRGREFITSHPWSPEKSDTPIPEELRSIESDTWTSFHNWMISVGAEDTSKLETVLTFATQWYPEYILDRSIMGDPRYPTQPGCYAGRFPLDPLPNLDLAVRTSMYRAIIFANPRRNRVNFSGVCYIAGNNGPGQYYFTGSEGVSHLINEFYGGDHWGDPGEPGVFQSMRDNGGDMMLHNGYGAGTGTDPMFGYPLNGFVEEINNGCGYFYYSGHGDVNKISAFTQDQGIRQDCAYGSTYWPIEAGIITEGGNSFTTDMVGSLFENVHSISAVFNACLVSSPGSYFDEAWLKKGAVLTIGSYVSVGWNNAGYFGCHFADELSLGGKTAGYAFGYSNALASAVYPTGQAAPYPDTLRFVLVGDPNMLFNQPEWQKPAPSALAQNYGGHKPGNITGVEVSHFGAEGHNKAITVSWSVNDESELSGYLLSRRITGIAPWQKITTNPISSGARNYTYEDAAVTGGNKYEYVLECIGSDGKSTTVGPVQARLTIRATFSLCAAAPNPMQSITTLRYSLAESGSMRLDVYDMSGRLIRKLSSGEQSAGEHETLWDGSDTAGRQVANGLYVYRLEAGGTSLVKRLVVAR